MYTCTCIHVSWLDELLIFELHVNFKQSLQQFAKLSEENIDLEELKIAEEPVFGDEERDPGK